MKIKTISPEGEKKLSLREGTKLKPYLDNRGVPTIGEGTTIYPNGKKVTMQDPPITKEQAREFMRTHLENETYPIIFKYIEAELNQNQFDALCSFVYNLGTQALWNCDRSKKNYNTPTRVTVRINNDPSDPLIGDAMLLFDKNNPGVHKRHEQEVAQYFS